MLLSLFWCIQSDVWQIIMKLAIISFDWCMQGNKLRTNNKYKNHVYASNAQCMNEF